ncbi:unnamed protein product [Linum trigynum]|uniref:Uncharacterized protein n=1 Tax=Linum trigynum TaxID=586398 RepID=A0AAV2F9D6_9ROSI
MAESGGVVEGDDGELLASGREMAASSGRRQAAAAVESEGGDRESQGVREVSTSRPRDAEEWQIDLGIRRIRVRDLGWVERGAASFLLGD